mmetsp:Transcript_4476/g.14675  ORF Transcript_4476/g.14675 Transcript_4476/m.14675 type:complete len:268 (+) Transcript_4476:620-1423(+)
MSNATFAARAVRWASAIMSSSMVRSSTATSPIEGGAGCAAASRSSSAGDGSLPDRACTLPTVMLRSFSITACSASKRSRRSAVTASRLNRISRDEYCSMRAWMAGVTALSQASPSPVSPRQIGPGLSPSSSYSLPLTGTYEMKWYSSSSSLVARRSSVTNGSGREKELCTLRIRSELEMASPRKSGGKSLVKALKAVSSSPRSIAGQFIRMDRMAWVAQAFEIICEAKKTSGSGSTVARSSFSPRQRNRKMRPWTGFISSMDSRSSE